MRSRIHGAKAIPNGGQLSWYSSPCAFLGHIRLEIDVQWDLLVYLGQVKF